MRAWDAWVREVRAHRALVRRYEQEIASSAHRQVVLPAQPPATPDQVIDLGAPRPVDQLR